jgi:hypothetical protein
LAAIEGAMACSYVVALAKSNHLLNDCIAGIGIGMGFLAAISTKLADHLKEGNKKIMETVFESGIAIDLPEELEAMLRAALESHRAAQLEA